MKIAILSVFLVTKFCFGKDGSIDMTESMNAEVTQKLHKGTPNLLLTLGDTLKENLLRPTPDKNQGEQTVKGLYDYFYNLEDVYDMMKNSEKVEKKLGMKLFRMLLESGGPPHIDLEDFDIEDTMTKYEWNNKAVFSVRQVLDDTESLWEKMQILAETIVNEQSTVKI